MGRSYVIEKFGRNGRAVVAATIQKIVVMEISRGERYWNVYTVRTGCFPKN